jgi:hypothetical protein
VLQIAKIQLDLIEEAPGPLPLGREQAAAVLEPTGGAARDGPDDVQVGQQGVGAGGFGANRRRRLVGHAQDEQRVCHHQVTRGVDAPHVGVIEPADLPCAEPMRHELSPPVKNWSISAASIGPVWRLRDGVEATATGRWLLPVGWRGRTVL